MGRSNQERTKEGDVHAGPMCLKSLRFQKGRKTCIDQQKREADVVVRRKSSEQTVWCANQLWNKTTVKTEGGRAGLTWFGLRGGNAKRSGINGIRKRRKQHFYWNI